MSTRRLLAVLLHPDDESFLMGESLAGYAPGGMAARVVTVTQLVEHEYFRLAWPPTAWPCPGHLVESADVPVSVS